MWKSILAWFDSQSYQNQNSLKTASNHIKLVRILPFIATHLACLGVIWVGISWAAVLACVVLYLLRMFAITAFYHRYFSHKAFKTSRVAQFLFALLGASAAQRGPLWWASHHRHHHVHSDTEEDVHSPRQQGFWWSHLAWFLANQNFRTNHNLVKELMHYRELRFLDRFDSLVPLLLIVTLYVLGSWLKSTYPQLHTSGWQMLVWGYAVSTAMLYHMTFTVNSLAHVWGKRRYATRDDSRNNWLIAVATLGEGWHNNHHHFPGAARQGFFWWEIDLTYYGLKVLAACRVIWDLKPVPLSRLHKNLINT